MISVVMTYFNRRYQLLRTLESIKYFGNPEIIVVDDASDERIDDIEGIKLIRIEPENKWWINSCMAFNIGLSHATGDIIIMQNAECVHTGDILSHCQNVRGIFSYGCYSLDRTLPEMPVTELRRMILREPQIEQDNHVGWYNHSAYCPQGLNFCSAISKSDMELLGGFDERYAHGICYDDNDFILRADRAKIKVTIIDDPFVIHQKHERTDRSKLHEEYKINGRVWDKVIREKTIKPPQNKYYGMEIKSI